MDGNCSGFLDPHLEWLKARSSWQGENPGDSWGGDELTRCPVCDPRLGTAHRVGLRPSGHPHGTDRLGRGLHPVTQGRLWTAPDGREVNAESDSLFP